MALWDQSFLLTHNMAAVSYVSVQGRKKIHLLKFNGRYIESNYCVLSANYFLIFFCLQTK